MLKYFYGYLVLCLIPIWFISYSIIRMARHWNDGKDKYIVLNRHVYFKWFLSFLMTILTFMHIIDLAIFADLSQIELASRSLFFSLLLLAWLTSFVLGIFENNKRLIMRWSGHRSFWPANILIHLMLIINDVLFYIESSPSFHWVFILESVYLSEVIFCSILTVYAVKRPNEFLIFGECDFAFLRRNTRKTLAGSPNTQDLTEFPRISIKSYKIKQEEGKSVICFTITSLIKSTSFLAKRNLQEFDALNRHIFKNFPASEYPNMKIPVLPNVSGLDIEEKVRSLSEYLDSLVFPEFFSETFLVFLGITGIHKVNLSKTNEEVLKYEENFEKQQFRSNSIAEKYFNPSLSLVESIDDQPAKHFSDVIEICIPRWVEKEDHIEYEIIWLIKSDNSSKSVYKRYKDLLEHHKILGKAVHPAKLPEFPSKNYLKKLSKIDDKALNLRKENLEAYMNHIYNDFAFLCTESLEFLGIPNTLLSFWHTPKVLSIIKISSPLICKPVIDDLGHHLLFTIKLAKFQDEKKKNEWEITKRYRQFDILHHLLSKRQQSPILSGFYECKSIKDIALPNLPGKSVGALVSSEEIETRRLGLEKYLEGLLSFKENLYSYTMRQFIEDPNNDQIFKIN